MEEMMIELEALTNLLEVKVHETLEVMYQASRQYVEVVYKHHAYDGMDETVSEELAKLELRYEEIRGNLATEYLARFNAEMFFNAVRSLAIYPTKLPTVIEDGNFTMNREDYVERFFGEQLRAI